MIVLFLVILVIACIAMPLGYAWRVIRLNEPALWPWLAVAGEAVLIVTLVMMIGRWDVVGIFTRYLLAGLFLAAVAVSWWRHRRRPWRAEAPVWRTHRTTVLSLPLAVAAAIYVGAGLLPDSQAHNLAFPLQEGRFFVGQGGGNVLLNHHAGHPEQRRAVDITAVGPAGFRARSLLPDEPERYVIFGVSVVSPCSGEVAEASDGLPDLAPPAADRDNPAGNHVVIACEGLEVTLAHLRSGSVAVAAGEVVATHEPVGEVGNSGNTTEPHLHIHAVDANSGTGVALTFDGRTPVRNSVYRR